MLARTLAFVLGNLTIVLFAQLPNWPTVLLVVFGIGFAVYQFAATTRIFNLFCLTTLGFLTAYHAAYSVLQGALPARLLAKPILITGVVSSIPIRKQTFQKFKFQLQKINNQAVASRSVALTWYAEQPVHAGEHWQLNVRLKRIHGFHNPGSFDYVKHMFAQGILYRGYVKKSNLNHLINNHIAPRFLLHHWRETVLRKLRGLDDSTETAVMSGLTIGYRDLISQEVWQIFRKTGTAHLLAISGLHIGLIAGLFYGFGFFVWRRTNTLMLYLPAKTFAMAASLLSALFYAGAAGFSLPTQRSMLMLAIYFLLASLKRHVSAVDTLQYALIAVLLYDPLASLGVSLWLSFAAVTMIQYVCVGRKGKIAYLKAWFKTQVACIVGLLPIGLWFFSQFSGVSLFANAVAIPWLGFVVLPLAFLCILSLPLSTFMTTHLHAICCDCIYLLINVLDSLTHYDYLPQLPHLNVVSFALLQAGCLLLLAPSRWPSRWLAGIFLLPWWFQPSAQLAAGTVKLQVLDVGQGLAVLVLTARHVLIYDTGAKFSAYSDAGQAVLLPLLQQNVIHHLNAVVVSHSDNDHIGGLASIRGAINIDKIYTSAVSKIPGAMFCEAGLHWQWDGVQFEFLHPGRDFNASKNNKSCVLRISNEQHQVLLAGDIERKAEASLMMQHANLSSDVLVVPHHGSRTSSSSAFLAAVRPVYAIISAGADNRYHLPSKMIVRRYQARHAKLLSTASSGMITVMMGKDLNVMAYLLQHKHFWNI